MLEALQSIQFLGISLLQIIEITLVFAITYIIAKIITRSLTKVFEKTAFPENIEKGIVKTTKYTIYLIGLFAAISVSGFDLTSVIIGLGAFSIAISFAMSNIIQNFVSGLLVQTDRTFKKGDEIKIQVFEGKVVKMGIRTTLIEAENGDIISIPNSIFATTPVLVKKSTSNNSKTG